MTEQRDLPDSWFYLIYVTSDSFMLPPVFRNCPHEVLQLRCCVSHFLWRRVDGTPETDKFSRCSDKRGVEDARGGGPHLN